MFQLSKQSYNDSKFKMESEGGSSSDFDDNDYSLEKNYDFLDLGIKEEQLDVKREKLDLDYEENVVSCGYILYKKLPCPKIDDNCR